MRAPRHGEMFRNPDLANTLEMIAEGGRDAFYEGEIAEKIAAFAAKHGAALTLDMIAVEIVVVGVLALLSRSSAVGRA